MDETMNDNGTIKVEVAYALPHKQALLETEVAAGATVMDAARQCGISERFGGIDLDNAKFGLFGKVVLSTQALKEGDRVEIYRPLVADPKDVRKTRAAKAKERRESEKDG